MAQRLRRGRLGVGEAPRRSCEEGLEASTHGSSETSVQRSSSSGTSRSVAAKRIMPWSRKRPETRFPSAWAMTPRVPNNRAFVAQFDGLYSGQVISARNHSGR